MLHEESFKSFFIQVFPLCILAGFGMSAAGRYLNGVHTSCSLRIPLLYVMIPPLLGLKGNIEMTFTSRISTIANIYGSLLSTKHIHLVFSNYIANFILACTGGIVVSIVSLVLCSDFSFILYDGLLTFATAIITSLFSEFILSLSMLCIVECCKVISIDPDSVAVPLSATIGDCLVLFVFTKTWSIIDSSFISYCAIIFACACIWIIFGPASTCLGTLRNKSSLAASPETINHCLIPLCSAVCLSCISGRVLASNVGHLVNLARLQPAINGVGGNLASILISRVTTRLSLIPEPIINKKTLFRLSSFVPFLNLHSKKCFHLNDSETDQLIKDSQVDRTLEVVELALRDSQRSRYYLLLITIPLHLTMLVISSALFGITSYNETTSWWNLLHFRPAVVLAYLSAGFLQVLVVVQFARWFVIYLWLLFASTGRLSGSSRLASLDFTAIAITTSIGDLIGTGLLALFLRLAGD